MPAEAAQPEKWTFSKIAQHASVLLGKSGAFATACGIILLWAALGPFFGYSDTWQLIVNTGTTIVTFLMVFLVQNTQNRDARALHLKLDELLRSLKPARNKLIDLENCSDEEIEHIARQFQALRQREKRASRRRSREQTIAGLKRACLPQPDGLRSRARPRQNL